MYVCVFLFFSQFVGKHHIFVSLQLVNLQADTAVIIRTSTPWSAESPSAHERRVRPSPSQWPCDAPNRQNLDHYTPSLRVCVRVRMRAWAIISGRVWTDNNHTDWHVIHYPDLTADNMGWQRSESPSQRTIWFRLNLCTLQRFVPDSLERNAGEGFSIRAGSIHPTPRWIRTKHRR